MCISRSLYSIVVILQIVLLFFSCQGQAAEERSQARVKAVNPGQNLSLFFITGDIDENSTKPFEAYQFDYQKGYHGGSSSTKTTGLVFSPYGWDSYQRQLYHERGVAPEDHVTLSVDMTFKRVFIIGSGLAEDFPKTRMYDGSSSREIKLLDPVIEHLGFSEYRVNSIAPFPALYYDFTTETLVLSNQFEGKADRFDMIPSDYSKDGVLFRVSRKQPSGSNFGETQYQYVDVIEEKIKAIDLTSIRSVAFGNQGILHFCDKFERDLYESPYPFKYILESKKPKFGGLVIDSNPPGGTLYLDGVSKGETPITIDSLLTGTYRISIALGEKIHEEYTTVVEGTVVKTACVLETAQESAIQDKKRWITDAIERKVVFGGEMKCLWKPETERFSATYKDWTIEVQFEELDVTTGKFIGKIDWGGILRIEGKISATSFSWRSGKDSWDKDLGAIFSLQLDDSGKKMKGIWNKTVDISTLPKETPWTDGIIKGEIWLEAQE